MVGQRVSYRRGAHPAALRHHAVEQGQHGPLAVGEPGPVDAQRARALDGRPELGQRRLPGRRGDHPPAHVGLPPLTSEALEVIRGDPSPLGNDPVDRAGGSGL